MMEQKPFAAFLDLIVLDQKICVIQKDILTVRQRLQQASARQQELTEKESDIQSHIDALRVQIALQEKEMQNIDLQEKAKKKLSATLSNHKEIKSLQVEIDSLARSQLEYEQLVMHSWNKLELAQKELAKLQIAHAQIDESLVDDIAAIELDILQQTHILNELLQERPAKVALVPLEWMEHYTTMSSKVSDPVVPVEQDSCSACFTSIAKQDTLRLQKKALLKCKMCFRLLYLPSVMHMNESS